MTDKRWQPRRNVIGPDGAEPGYRASRWSEFKRLFVMIAWENEWNRTLLVVGPIVIAVCLFGAAFLGWR